MSQLMRNILVWLAISGITFVAIQNIYNQSPSQNMNYSEFCFFSNTKTRFPKYLLKEMVIPSKGSLKKETLSQQLVLYTFKMIS